MSLINKMLQDLEQRHAEGAAGGLPPQVRATPAPQHRMPWMTIVVLLVISLCVLAAWIWLRPVAAKRSAVPVPAVLVPAASVVPASAPMPVAPPSLALKVDDDLSISSIAQIPPAAETRSSTTTVPLAEAEPAAKDEEAREMRRREQEEADARRRSEPAQGKKAQDKLAQNKSGSVPQRARPDSRPIPDVAPVKNAVDKQSLGLTKQVKDWTPQQKAENEFRRATTLIQQGRAQEASALLEHALQDDATHVGARQTLIALMLNAKRRDDAMRLARQGLELDARQINFAMILARLQLDKGDQKAAIATLQRSLPSAGNSAEYQAFLAALMQRDGRHADAINLYEAALDKEPQSGVWWMGLGISLQADNRPQPAREAFIHARETASLSPELQAFVEQKIRQLSH